jgi:uncharacterized protein (DUF433 family)
MATKTRSKTKTTTRAKTAKKAGSSAAKRSSGRRRSGTSESFNRREAALLADISLRSVDKAIEEKVVTPRRSSKRAPALDSGDVLALALFARARLPLGSGTKKLINQWVHGAVAEDPDAETLELLLSDVLVLRIDDNIRALAERLDRYAEARESLIETDPEVMGGEPVIAGTRIPVRAVAVRVHGGESIEDLCEDYPAVPQEAFEAALTYAQAHPRRGRPARPWLDG